MKSHGRAFFFAEYVLSLSYLYLNSSSYGIEWQTLSDRDTEF